MAMNGHMNGHLQAGPGVPRNEDQGSSVGTRRSQQDTIDEREQWPGHFVSTDDDISEHVDNSRPDPRVKQIRNLSTLDVASLIANKMIGARKYVGDAMRQSLIMVVSGTGIFTGPSTVLQLTLNKNVAIGLWTLGLIYTLLSMMLYIEYARKLPFTGGELVYMDDAMPKPRLLAYTLYAFYFVFLYTSTANCMNFARFVLAAANTSYFSRDGLDENQRLVRFMAVVAITSICILLYVSNTKSKLVNQATAGAKILLLLGAIFAGAAYIGKEQSAGRLSGSSEQWSMTATTGAVRWPLALITVLFSYHGWENATLVAGEVDSFKVLRRGFLLAVFGVGALYIAMAILVCAAFDWQNGGSENDVPIVPLALYFGGSQDSDGTMRGRGAIAAAMLISMSAFGSILSVSYTCVRVKQSIGWANILPWSQVWRRQGPIQPDYGWQVNKDNVRELTYTFSERPFNRPGTPEGGIILHWLTTVLYICGTAGYARLTNAITFANQILVFGHFWAEAAVAFLFIGIGSWGFSPGPVTYFPAWNWHSTSKGDSQSGHPPKWLRPAAAPWAGPLLLGSSVFVASFVVIGAACADSRGRILLYVVLGIIGGGLAYWWGFVRYASAHKVYQFFGFRLKKQVHGIDDKDDPLRVCDWCDLLNAQHRHPTESYEFYNTIQLESKNLGPRLLYTFFDGTNQDSAVQIWHDLWQKLWSCFGPRQRTSQSIALQSTS
ncbi:putative amino acid/polyamine transporter I [Septoria linicola]|nr:putative amino acid/polyamine transporter I [Septoria linicola]